ncbi:hypothetical protein ACFQY5_10050 [Paeniroseomonas aquatica]|uniref:hypothetical protein n=1 Tax=Paeniroseomonas aquatica TaxID=373043 RepID=UPI00361F238B
MQWLLRARFDWQPAPEPADTAGRLRRAFYAALTRQATAAGLRLRPETLAALRDWIGLTARRSEEPAAELPPDTAPALTQAPAMPTSPVAADTIDP